MSHTDYYRLLNSKVFFWLTEDRLHRLLSAKAYRTQPNLVLTVDTKALVDRYQDEITLSPINSGSTIYKPLERGEFTFKPIRDYDFELWRRKRSRTKAVTELAVECGVPEIMKVLMTAEKYNTDGSVDRLWSE